MGKESKVFVIFDGNAIIHRAYHALPPLTSRKIGLANAVYGFFLVFFKAINDFKPDFAAVAFDFPAPNFRHSKYKLYKANRIKAPNELYEQIPKTKEILKNFNIQIIEKKGYEADDVLGTISKTAPKKHIYPMLKTIIVSGDMDVLQLVDKNTNVFALRKGVKDIVLYDEEKVKEKYGGLAPKELVEYKALRGDPSDNIPGVFGIGEKTAISLIREFKSIDNLYDELKNNTDSAKKIKQNLKQKLVEYKEQAYVSKMLAQIRHDADIDFDMDKCVWGNYDKEKIAEIFNEYGFKTLAARVLEKESKGVSKKEKPTAKHLFSPPFKKAKRQEKIPENNLNLWGN